MFRIFVCSDHSNTVKESVPSLPRYAYVRSTEISPIIYEVRPDDGVRSSRFRLRALRWPAIQRLLHEFGQFAEGYALVLALSAESITCGSNVLIIQIQSTQFIPKILDHVQHHPIVRFALAHWRLWRRRRRRW